MTLGWIGAHGGEGVTGPVTVSQARPVWVDLDLAFPLPADHHRRVIVDGLHLTGRIPGMLKRWIRGSRSEWYGLVWLPLPDGAGDVRLTLDTQLIPGRRPEPANPPNTGLTQTPSDREYRIQLRCGGMGSPLYDAAMPIEISGRRVFLASPGDMSSEREACRKVIRKFNEERSESEQVVFIVRAWEDLAGGIGRPQDRINPKLDDCDFMILILGDRWGSSPALDGPYSSGTEEEFHRCVHLLAQPDAAMRDLLVLFKTLDAGKLRDPGPQLLKVMGFRDSLDRSKALQYMTFDSDESLSTAIVKKLAEWAGPLGARRPLEVRLPDAKGSVEPPTQATREQLLRAAREHVANGLLMQAEAAFAHAIKDGNVDAVSEYALFMRRTGRLEQALELNRQIIEDPTILSATDRDSVAHRVNALANMGVIHRKRGSLSDSINTLREAVCTAESSRIPIHQEWCYALDNYGLSLLRTNEVDLANTKFEKARALRKEFGTGRDLAQSAANLGRRALLLKDYRQASEFFVEALGNPDTESDDHLLANVLCGLAEVRLMQGSTEDVRNLLDQALELNTGRGNSDGVSIAHSLLARFFLLEDALDSAAEHAELCRQEAEKTNNATGQGTAALLLALTGLARGRREQAREYLIRAAQYSGKSGNEPLMEEIGATMRRLTSDDSDARHTNDGLTETSPVPARTST